MNESYKLNTTWKVWFHSIDDDSWTNNSYKLIYTIHNLYDIQLLIDNIHSNHLQNGMFFIMRNDIFPTWEDCDNREGCSISFKVPASHLKNNWDLFMTKILTEDILINKEKFSEINGFSISPKREFNILKLWLKNNNSNYEEFIKEYQPYFIKSKSIHKKHF